MSASVVCAATLLAAAPSKRPLDADADRMTRAGQIMLGTGGGLMVVASAVLVPISLTMALRAQPPDPEQYTAVEPFESDLYQYELKMWRATMIGGAGAITGAIGAATFTSGAVVWGVARRRSRRISASLGPSRGGLQAGLRLRF